MKCSDIHEDIDKTDWNDACLKVSKTVNTRFKLLQYT